MIYLIVIRENYFTILGIIIGTRYCSVVGCIDFSQKAHFKMTLCVMCIKYNNIFLKVSSTKE